MILEKWDTRFDVDRLRDHLERFVFPLASVQQSPAFGGWSVLSSNGSYLDGWQPGHLMFDQKTSATGKEAADKVEEHLKKMGLRGKTELRTPTEICHGYLAEVVERLKVEGLAPSRVRIVKLTKGMASIWHRDGGKNGYFVRLHVPIITNPLCFFETEEGRAHMHADGSSYFIHVNRMHCVRNDGTADRYHLIADVWDKSGISTFHRYSESEGDVNSGQE